jgi:hypothetical protein
MEISVKELDDSPTLGAAFANAMLASPGVFDDSRDRRIIQGICTTGKVNSNGVIFDPAGAKFDLPLPLIFNHAWSVPCGRVTKIQVRPDGLFFEARIIDGRLAWSYKCWQDIKAGRVPAVSVHGWNIPPYVGEWQLQEVSLCEVGACPGALIHVAKTVVRPGVVRIVGPKETVHRDIRATLNPSDFCRRMRGEYIPTPAHEHRPGALYL